MKSSWFLVILITMLAGDITAQDIDYKGFPQWSWHKQDSTEYYLYTPVNMEAGKKYPVALFMHGCCGTSYKASLRNTVDPPVRMWHNFGKNEQTIPTYIVAPATSQGWKQHFGNIRKIIEELISHKNADPQRIYVTGFSMGGDGTFGIIQEYPGFFAAALPMGMGFRGDSSLVKDVPIWTSQGEKDWFARNLRKNVMDIRRLNGYLADTGATWITGVNPRYSNFKGVGHGVQWKAASTQDLTGWAYAHVNDGNLYPSVYFEDPMYNQTVDNKARITLNVKAWDADGSISEVRFFRNKKQEKIRKKMPFEVRLKMHKGDNHIEAVAVDNKGKTAVASTIIRVNIPPLILNKHLPAARAGEYYTYKLNGRGNGILTFRSGNALSETGLELYPDGTLKGYPVHPGVIEFTAMLTDQDGEITSRNLRMETKPASPDEVIISGVRTAEGAICRVRRMQEGEAPFFNREDTLLSTETEEINFSGTDKYEGFHFIQTAVNDAQINTADFLQFDISDDAVVYVAYEKLDLSKKSSIPDWLKSYHKEEGEIVAQYRYFNVYSKTFPKGRVMLPGADAKTNGVAGNYFVIVRKKQILF